MENKENLKYILESILFVSGDMISTKDLAISLECGRNEIMEALDELDTEYNEKRRGINLVFMNDKVQMSSRVDYCEIVENVLSPIRTKTLTESAIEVMSIVAYRQPVTRGEIAEIRGVRSEYIITSLLKKNYIRECGKKDTIGHPAQFATTEIFLRDFNLSSIAQLPHIEEA